MFVMPERTVTAKPGDILPDYEGLEVVFRRLTVGQAFDLSGLYGLKMVPGGLFTDGVSREELDRMSGLLADRFVRWNAVESFNPMDLDADLVRALVESWMDALTAVPDPLGRTSTGTDTSVVESIPMDVS